VETCSEETREKKKKKKRVQTTLSIFQHDEWQPVLRPAVNGFRRCVAALRVCRQRSRWVLSTPRLMSCDQI
jgi:hypothetical protein